MMSLRKNKGFRVLLVLNEKNGNVRIMVRVEERRMKDRVILYLEENRGREAFDLLKRKAEVEAFLPAGAKLPFVPQVTLVEDLIA
jgi:hypothetical protein